MAGQLEYLFGYDLNFQNVADALAESKRGEYKTWTPGPWTFFEFHGPGSSKYGAGP